MKIRDLDYSKSIPDLFQTLEPAVLNSIVFNMQLEPIQQIKVKECLQVKRSVLESETGLGKTYNIVAFLQALKCEIKNGEYMVLVVKKDKMTEFQDAVNQFTSYKSIAFTGEQKQITKGLDALIYDGVDLIITSNSAWGTSLPFALFMYNTFEHIVACCYDESAGIDDMGFNLYVEIASRVPFSLQANATPIGRNFKLIYNLLRSVDAFKGEYMSEFKFKDLFIREREASSNFFNVDEDIDVEKINEMYGKHFIGYNRDDVGLVTNIERCDIHIVAPNVLQKAALITHAKIRTEDLKAGSFEKEPNKLVQAILQTPRTTKKVNLGYSTEQTSGCIKMFEIIDKLPKEDNTMIFCEYIKACEDIERCLQEKGYNVLVYNGSIKSKKKKDAIREQFNNSTGTILITNSEIGSNFGSAKHIIIYSYPTSMPQCIYRIIRGFRDVSVTIDIIHYYVFEEKTIKKLLYDIDLVERKTKRKYEWKNMLLEKLKDFYPQPD